MISPDTDVWLIDHKYIIMKYHLSPTYLYIMDSHLSFINIISITYHFYDPVAAARRCTWCGSSNRGASISVSS